MSLISIDKLKQTDENTHDKAKELPPFNQKIKWYAYNDKWKWTEQKVSDHRLNTIFVSEHCGTFSNPAYGFKDPTLPLSPAAGRRPNPAETSTGERTARQHGAPGPDNSQNNAHLPPGITWGGGTWSALLFLPSVNKTAHIVKVFHLSI